MLKMSSNTGRLIQKFAFLQFNKEVTKSIHPISAVHKNTVRTLFSREYLGLDTFELQRERTKQQLSNLEDKFKERMREYVSDEKNMIFTEDLKNMVYLTTNDQDAELVVSMTKRFNSQNQQLRFGSFKFGPVMMRMFYLLNKPQLAIECFKDEKNFGGFFDQLITFQTYLDLLYENGMFKEVLENFKIIENRQLEGALFPRNSFVIALAACYRINTPESYEYALDIWNRAKEHGYYPTRRAITFSAGLALEQGKPEVALEMVSSSNNQNYTTVRNIKTLALAQMGRLEEAIALLKTVLSIENGEHTYNRDVLDKVKNCVLAADNPDISVEFNRIEQILQKQGNITDISLNEHLCSEIKKPPTPTRPHNQDRGQYGYTGFNRRQPMNRRERPGLNDLV